MVVGQEIGLASDFFFFSVWGLVAVLYFSSKGK